MPPNGVIACAQDQPHAVPARAFQGDIESVCRCLQLAAPAEQTSDGKVDVIAKDFAKPVASMGQRRADHAVADGSMPLQSGML